MAGLRVHFVMPAELVERIDGVARERGMSRGEWVRRVCEGALAAEATPLPPFTPRPEPEFVASHDATIRPTSAPGPSLARSSVQAKRDVRPIPKKGEK